MTSPFHNSFASGLCDCASSQWALGFLLVLFSVLMTLNHYLPNLDDGLAEGRNREAENLKKSLRDNRRRATFLHPVFIWI
jgi:hypothetical protein